MEDTYNQEKIESKAINKKNLFKKIIVVVVTLLVSTLIIITFFTYVRDYVRDTA